MELCKVRRYIILLYIAAQKKCLLMLNFRKQMIFVSTTKLSILFFFDKALFQNEGTLADR